MSSGFARMPQYSVNERVWLVQRYFKSCGHGRGGGPSIKATVEGFEQEFQRLPPAKSSLMKMVKKHGESGTVHNLNKGHSGIPRTARTNENHGKVMDAILRSPKKSIRRMSREMRMSYSSARRLTYDLVARSYKIQVFHELKPTDFHNRIQYCARTLANVYMDPQFLDNVWWSDESNILLSGHVNKQNMRWLGWEKPDECEQKPLHSVRITVWCALSARGIIGPYYIENAGGNCINVDSAVYREQVVNRLLADNCKHFAT